MKFFFVFTACILLTGCTHTLTARKDENIDVFEDVLQQLEKETQRQSQVYFKQLALNDEQLGLYAVWYETLTKNNTSPMLVFAQRLLDSLGENAKVQFRQLYALYRKTSQLAQSFNQKSKEFEKKKSYYLNSLKRQFPKNYANIETRVNQLLAY